MIMSSNMLGGSKASGLCSARMRICRRQLEDEIA